MGVGGGGSSYAKIEPTWELEWYCQVLNNNNQKRVVTDG